MFHDELWGLERLVCSMADAAHALSSALHVSERYIETGPTCLQYSQPIVGLRNPAFSSSKMIFDVCLWVQKPSISMHKGNRCETSGWQLWPQTSSLCQIRPFSSRFYLLNRWWSCQPPPMRTEPPCSKQAHDLSKACLVSTTCQYFQCKAMPTPKISNPGAVVMHVACLSHWQWYTTNNIEPINKSITKKR